MRMLCCRQDAYQKSNEDERIEDLKCELATLSGFWPPCFGLGAEKVLESCDRTAAFVSIAGAAPDGATLTILGSYGLGACAAPVGRILPSPWPASWPDNEGSTIPSKFEHNCKDPSDKVFPSLFWKSGSQLSLPYEWHQLLGQARFSETLVLRAHLEPLVLGSKLVGALLVVAYAGKLPHSHERLLAPAPFTSAVTWTGEGEGGGVATTPAAPTLLQRLKLKKSQAAAGAATSGTGKCKAGAISTPSPRLLRGIAAAVAQLAFGPHLRAVSRICSACQTLASATSLYVLGAVLSSTISEALAMDLHVNLNVRVAIVPPVYGQNGYFLPLESSTAQTACDPIHSLPAAGSGGNMLQDLLHKRAASGVVSGCTSLRTMAIPRTISGRDDSSTGLSPCSAPNVILSGQAGYTSPLRCSDGKAISFALPSSLLLQLLRPVGLRPGNASAASSVHAGNFHCQPAAAPTTDEPTVRSIVTRACESMTTQCYSDLQPVDYLMSSSVLASARESNLQVQLSGASASCIPQRVGVGVTSGGPPSVGAGAVSGMVVANLHAWMQDVERPSSDVALLMMAARGRGVPGGAAPGRPSQGGAGGAALGVGPACLVALAGCALPRPTAANTPAAASGSIHAARSVKPCRRSADWVQNLEASMRGGVTVDLSIRHGNGHGSGNGNGNGVSCGPCVALYLTAQERLPTSLLRAVKDRAAGLLEILLPACFNSLTSGPLCAEVENLATASAAAVAAGGSRSKRSLATALAAGLHSSPGPCSPASGAGGLPSPSSLPSLSPSHLHLHSGLAGLTGGSPVASVIGGGSDNAETRTTPRAVALLCSLGARLGPSGPLSASGHPSPAILPSAHSPLRLLDMAAVTEGGAPTPGAQASGAGDRMSTSTAALSREIHLIAQQQWPEGVGARGGDGAAAGQRASGGQRNSPYAPPAVPPATIASSQSRTTRGSPGSCGFRAGVEESSLMASMDVTGAMDDVSSMRDNLDVWVHSFWEMLRDAPPNKSGHTHGSYADDDLRYLRLYQRLGSGGAASVYAGVLLGMDVAVKVIEPPPHVDVEALASTQPLGPSGSLGEATAKAAAGAGPEGQGVEETEEGRMAELAAAVRQAQMRELVRSARECAVLTTVSHPAIVQVYSYHTRVQVVPGEGPDGLPRLVPVPPGEGNEAQGPLHSVLVMERCDLGSLADALDNGMFKKAIIAAANNSGPLSASPPTVPRSPGGGVRHQLSGGPTSSNSGGGSPGFTFATSHGGGGGGGGSAMRAIYLTLLEVALALRHLHSMNLVHCDVKVANVLLKSSSSDPRGFTCKLSDFGLVNLLRSEEESPEQEQEQEQEQGSDGNGRAGGAASRRQGEAEGRRPVTGGWEGCKPWMRNADAAGTVTHLAPECFEPDRKLDQSVDIYAFGIVMWEVFTRKPPYAEFAPDFEDLPIRVMEGLRLRFPSHCPPQFKALAQACWVADAAQRPTAAAVVTCLQNFLDSGFINSAPGTYEPSRAPRSGAVPGPSRLQGC
ncbi:hypothetical protein VaNZ11_014927 [Volvox africanus]|uniref:Protein kinase domain-containing protein n=1 Tax=Volvox africanus TaxID=51714 RepID=A0ABQ5SKH7_9CHLO|nr:hypothetical protein VaNZ11_014927 [Volvox africanus]